MNMLSGENGLNLDMREKTHAYGAPMESYNWGSNGAASRRGSVYTQRALIPFSIESSRYFYNAGGHYLHYLHGVNPFGLVFLTNMERYGAEKSASELYHAWFKNGSSDYDSTISSTYGPAPGFLVGGPNPWYERDECCETQCGGFGDKICELPILSPPVGQPPMKSYAEFNDGWPLNSWSVTENSNSYQVSYIRLLSKYAK
jgi:hypothetical protein